LIFGSEKSKVPYKLILLAASTKENKQLRTAQFYFLFKVKVINTH
jgi:hypothetical protein